jgi:tripartite-type tricarboxylate transporter receptor subunit TctC
MDRRKHCRGAVAAFVLTLAAAWVSPLQAQSWPQRPVRLIVPIGPGSSTDIIARIYADRLAERWKQPVVVENRPGADGLIGTGAFVAAHDDHTLLFSFAAPVSVLPYLHARLSYDPARDLVPISLAVDTFGTITAHASLEIGSLKEMAALARAQPGKFNYFGGQGAFPYLFAGFAKSQNLDLVQLAYREFNLGLQDHRQGRTHFLAATLTSALPVVQAGDAKFLAVTNSKRSPMIPDVPTAAEQGYPELAFEGLMGLFGPRAMPVELIDRISRDIRAVAAEPAVADRLAALGGVAHGSAPAEFAALVEAQRAKFAGIVQEIGIHASR